MTFEDIIHRARLESSNLIKNFKWEKIDMQKDYAELLNQLVSGELQTLQISSEEFMEFQTAYMNFESRKKIVGEAQANGIVVYHFENGPK